MRHRSESDYPRSDHRADRGMFGASAKDAPQDCQEVEMKTIGSIYKRCGCRAEDGARCS
jgi:hypothetical protein